MNDLEKLNELASWLDGKTQLPDSSDADLIRTAIDEIKKLRGDNTRLRNAATHAYLVLRKLIIRSEDAEIAALTLRDALKL